jgi:hypothetical protein
LAQEEERRNIGLSLAEAQFGRRGLPDIGRGIAGGPTPLADLFKGADIAASFDDIADTFSTSMRDTADDMKSIIQGVIQPTLSEVWTAPGDDRRVDEWARRLATMAGGNLNSEWRDQLTAQFGGEVFFQPVMDALAAQDPTALSAAVTNLLSGGGTQLFDKELIKQRVREQLQQQNLMSELIATVQAELAAEGVTVGLGDVQAAAGLPLAQPIIGQLEAGIKPALEETNVPASMLTVIADQMKGATAETEMIVTAFNANFEAVILTRMPGLAGIWIDGLTAEISKRIIAAGGVTVAARP